MDRICPRPALFLGHLKNFFRRVPFIDQAEIERVKDYLASSSNANSQNLSPGDQIRVIEGPFQNFSGMIEVVDEDRARVTAGIKVFGRNTPVELHFSQVEKLA